MCSRASVLELARESFAVSREAQEVVLLYARAWHACVCLCERVCA